MRATTVNLSYEGAFRAVELVRERLERATAALSAAGVPYAVVGGIAIAAWVTTVKPSAVRNTKVVDILLRRRDLDAAKAALQSAGFIYRHAAGLDFFLDGPEGEFRDGVHVIFANEKVRPGDAVSVADVSQASDIGSGFPTIDLEPLVIMKLTADRHADRTHIVDLIRLGMVDESWLNRVPAKLKERLEALLQSPELKEPFPER